MSENKFPLVYEINTRLWLKELTEKHRKRITLGNIPDAEFQKLKQCRFDCIWLMGVWKPSPKGKEIALNHLGLRKEYTHALPNWTEEDVVCSPYCIADYTVSNEIGGDSELQKFRQQLLSHGMTLILDFVPNHVALDHPWLEKKPEYFISAPKEIAYQNNDFYSPDGIHFFACGKDPYFPAWTDTLQLNYSNEKLRAAMIEVLVSLAHRCDGVRCDMAMLLLKTVFNQTWQWIAGEMHEEFWNEAIVATRAINPNFLFIAEAYWETEWLLQQLGFDFTYDKKLYDRMQMKDISGIKSHLLANWDYQRKMVCFTENHDEERSIHRFEENNRAALLLVLTMPCMRLIHQGQLEGYSRRLPVQLIRRYAEEGDEKIGLFYHRLAHSLRNPAIASGGFEPIKLEGSGSNAVVGFSRFYGKNIARTFTLINLSDFQQEVYFFTEAFQSADSYEHLELITTDPKHSPQLDLWNGGITVRLRANEGLLLMT